MMTLKLLMGPDQTIPASISWYLADIGEAKGKQGLFVKQSPQRLKALREHALIESAVSSNRIEGVEVDRKRVGTIIFGKQILHDRSEEEVRGYREALNGKHDPWPYIGFICYIIKAAYKEFEERLGNLKSPRGEKTSMVVNAIEKLQGQFSVGSIASQFPGISIDMIRRIFKDLQAEGQVECLGRGRNATWRRTGKK